MNIGDRLALLRIFCKFIYTKFISSYIKKGSTLSIPCRDGFTLGVLGGGGGVHTPLAPSRGGAIFMIKQKNMRDIMKYTL